MSQDLVLQVRDLNVWYRPSGTIGRRKRRQVLHDVSFDLHRGEILGLVGESGSGKTTLARTILGFVPDYTGTVTHFTKRPQMVFQDPASSLNPSRTVGWILAEPLRIYGSGPWSWWAWTRSAGIGCPISCPADSGSGCASARR